MPILLLDIERQLDAADERAEQLGARLLYVGELAETLSDPAIENRELKLAFLAGERDRLVAEIGMMIETASRLEALRDQALAGDLD